MMNKVWGESSQTKSVSETVYEILHRNIINLNISPGTLMSEKDISAKMEVSRTPVREAFIKLSNEALVAVVPQKGSSVTRINLSRVKEERFLRESLELAVIEDLINSPDHYALDELELNLEQQKTALEKEDHSGFMELDDAFHACLFRLADRTMCYDLAMSFSSHYRRVRYLSMSVRGVSEENLRHHRQILDFISRKNLPDALKLIKTHLRKLDLEKEQIMGQFPDYFEGDSPAEKLLAKEKELFQSS